MVNYDGRDYLERCLQSLLDLDYPADRVEIVLIDNASTDGSVPYVREEFPDVRVVTNDKNTGFAPAVNQGARLGKGRYLALINNDAEADPAWLRAAVGVLEGEHQVACVACKILREDRRTVDYAGGQMPFFGHGVAKGVEETDSGEAATRPTLFASGGAMVARRKLFLDVGGFDESYFAFFEDVDFGWRLWVLGRDVWYVPTSVVYHRHHGTIERFGYPRERYLLERNALATIFKNYSDDLLARILPAAVVLTVFRGLELPGFELPDYRIPEAGGEDPEPLEVLEIPALVGAHLAALRDFVRSLDDLRAKRTVIQDQRVRADRTVMKLFEESLRPNVFRPDFLDGFEQVVRAFDLNEHARPRSRVLVVCDDHLGDALDPGGARTWELATLLAHEHEVVLASTQPPQRSADYLRTTHIHAGNIDEELAHAEVVVLRDFLLDELPQIADADVPVVLDASDPSHLTGLRDAGVSSAARFAEQHATVDRLNRHLDRADLVLCASEKQRDFWLGQLASIGRINPATFDADRSLRSLLAAAPQGCSRDAPEAGEPALREVVDGIGGDDFVLLWAGALDHGADAETLVRAVAAVSSDHPDLRLVFWGAARPGGGPWPLAAAVRRLADDLGVLDRGVFLLDGWPAYDERARYLVEADVGVALATSAADSLFADRPEVADYLWAGLPLLVSVGTAAGWLVAEHEAGVAVPPGDVEALARMLRRLRTDADLRKQAAARAQDLVPEVAWDATLDPLRVFCRAPRRAPDRFPTAARYVARDTTVVTRPPRYYARRFADYVHTMGLRGALAHAGAFARRRLGRS